jgi:ABC-type bacteriocin/lantibiotic exporter with double-glycine peptidase domain
VDTTPVVKALSLTIAHEEKIAIGSSGSGKAAFLMILLQMINVQKGRITIDDADLSNSTLKRYSCAHQRYSSRPIVSTGHFQIQYRSSSAYG